MGTVAVVMSLILLIHGLLSRIFIIEHKAIQTFYLFDPNTA
jgi:hypothetical protein